LLINEMPRYEILDESSMQELERGWRRIVSELGLDFGTSEPHEPTIALLEAAGQ
jgi:trimethylamine--corrinoid protein Co-methyltransferase